MKKIILFYSYTGSSKAFAQKLANETGTDIEEVQTEKRPGTVSAYVLGSFAALKQKSAPILPIKSDLGGYDQIILIAPIWAGNPAPAFNSILDKLPQGTLVELYLMSGSGESKKDRITAHVKGKGFEIKGYHDIKASVDKNRTMQ